MIYKTLNHKIDPQALAVTDHEGQSIDIRPKTCQLLIYLIEHRSQAVSKQELLAQVWGGSVVSEQVVFQSINEIRRLFGDSEIIKTLPQQGYLWLPEVAIQKKSESKVTKVRLYALAGLALLGAALTVFIAPSDLVIKEAKNTQSLQATGSIVILPIENHISGNDHAWVRLGLMDQVIQRLPNSKAHLVLQSDYVFEVLKRAGVSEFEVGEEDISQLFRTSGAELIVAAKLIGAPFDYKLSYTFYYRQGSKKGALFHTQLQPLADEFVQVVASQFAQQQTLTNEVNYQSDFNNELLGNAIESSVKGEHELSKNLLQSLLATDPENITAHRLLARAFFRLKQFDRANEQLDKALVFATKKQDKAQLTRLLYSKSLYFYVTMRDDLASEWADKALAVATEINDWLLLAYITNVKANIALNEGDYESAEALYHTEKDYQKVLHCPVGEASAWGSLARLAKIAEQGSKFDKAINNAIDIAEKRGLERQLSSFLKMKGAEINQ